jgi:hypothetical protein
MLLNVDLDKILLVVKYLTYGYLMWYLTKMFLMKWNIDLLLLAFIEYVFLLGRLFFKPTVALFSVATLGGVEK